MPTDPRYARLYWANVVTAIGGDRWQRRGVDARVAASTDAGVVAGIADTQIDLSVADSWAYGYAGSYFENRFRGCTHIGAAPRKRGNLCVEL